MLVGENARPVDLPINICEKKHPTNIRASLRPGICRSMKRSNTWLTKNCLKSRPNRIIGTEERGKQTKNIKEQWET